MIRRLFVLAVAAASLLGCEGLLDPSRKVTMRVAHNLVPCHDAHGPTQCMLVQRNDGLWSNFFGAINGFVYEPGFVYALRVRETDIDNPPQDASSVDFTLLAVLQKKPCSAPPASPAAPPDICF